LALLNEWVDDPSNARFDEICAIVFGDDAPVLDSVGAVWWALRTATSSVGNYEAGWALSSAFDAACAAGLATDEIYDAAIGEVQLRRNEFED
jgi:hypothetical protein